MSRIKLIVRTEEYILTEDDLGHFAYLLYSSPLFAQHAIYIRHQLIYCLLQVTFNRWLYFRVFF